MASSVVKFTNVFEDGSEMDITVGEISPTASALMSIKAKVMEFNEKIGDERYPDFVDFPDLMVSKTGAKWKRIDKVQIITTQRNYIF